VGELLKAMKASSERAKSGGEAKKPKESRAATLWALGITKDQSSDWQKLARTPAPAAGMSRR